MNSSDTNHGRQAGILLLARVILFAFALAAGHAHSQIPGNEKGEAALRLLEKMQTGTSQDASVLKHKAVLYAQKKQEVHAASFASHESAVLKDYSHLPLSFVRVYSMKAPDKLLMHPGITGGYENTVMKMLLAEGLPLVKQLLVASAGNQGVGTAVAVLNSGVELPILRLVHALFPENQPAARWCIPRISIPVAVRAMVPMLQGLLQAWLPEQKLWI